MHNLAIALSRKGHQVTGSDDEIFEPSKSRLKEHGLFPDQVGWRAENISGDLDAVIVGMHARQDNPELLKARKLNIPTLSFPEFLYDFTKNKKRIVIGGSHGKTTITSMVMHVLKYAGIPFDYLVGAKLDGFDVMVGLDDSSRIAVFEGDEYLTSPLDPRPKFHLYKPHIALISGIAWDHCNVFPTWEIYVEQFRKFVDLIESGGILVANANDKVLEQIINSAEKDISIIRYALPDHHVRNGITYVNYNGVQYPLKVFGQHNLENIAGAREVCKCIGVNEQIFHKAMMSFLGAAKRLQLIRENGNSSIFLDFAHAPSKVAATVSALKSQFPGRRLVACLELHTFSSLSKGFISNYRGVFGPVDTGIVYYNPHSLKLKRLPGLSDKDIMDAFAMDNLLVFNDSGLLQNFLRQESWPGKNLLFMSSGNFDGFNFDEIAGQLLS